jgi:glycosidase
LYALAKLSERLKSSYAFSEADTHLFLTLAFDPEWATNGLQEKAVDLFTKWVESQQVAGLKMDVRI